MSVYYEALELNTALKPYAFRRFLTEPGVASVTYLDPDIYVFRPLDGVRQGLAEAQLALTPHLTRPLLGSAMPNDRAILKSGSFNLGFCAARAEPKVVELMSWWADRCEFDCRVDLKNGLFTDQRWMDLSPGFVDSLAVLRDPGLNLAYWTIEGRNLGHAGEGWTVDGGPLTFFHYSGFDPLRPDLLSKHQDRVRVVGGSPLAELLQHYSAAMMRNGYKASCGRFPMPIGPSPLAGWSQGPCAAAPFAPPGTGKISQAVSPRPLRPGWTLQIPRPPYPACLTSRVQ